MNLFPGPSHPSFCLVPSLSLQIVSKNWEIKLILEYFRPILGLFYFFFFLNFAVVCYSDDNLTLSDRRSFAIPTVLPILSLASAIPYMYSAVSYVSICNMI